MEFGHPQSPRDSLPPPPPPPKMNLESPVASPDWPPTPSDYFNSRGPSRSSSPSRHLNSAGPLSPPMNGGASEALLTPSSPNPAVDATLPPPSPSGSSFRAKQSKKSNPLTDLVDSEREYIDLLAGIIRKVAGAWSRTNFPPKQLDAMFRGVESVYKANRGLLTKLKDIGPSPTSPKALGDLLMRWIDDLDAPYTKYCTNFAAGFDGWQPIASNSRLPPILAALSVAHPPPLALLPPQSEDSDPSIPPTWTLDALFALPRARLKYYKKLYTRLLKSTQPGRSDHKLLTGAVEKLETLLGTLTERGNIVIGQETERTLDDPPRVEAESRSPLEDGVHRWQDRVLSGSETTDERARGSLGSSVPPSSLSSEARGSRDTVSSRGGGRTASSATMSMPISDLERRLSTERVLDIFTLKPKAVRLQMNPPSLPFTRSLRLSHNVEIHFTSRAAPDSPIVHSRGHIFLLTDLFLICERMTPDERQIANSADGQDYDMWLLYPPLAGKHLRVSECADQDNALQIQVLKKEVLFLHAESKNSRDQLVKEFKECIESASLLSPRAGQPAPPPVPPLKTQPLSPSEASSHDRDPRLSPNTATSSTTSPASGPSANASPQSPDHGRAEAVDSSRHASFPTQQELHPPAPFSGPKGLPSHPSVGLSPVDPPGGRLPPPSASQPQMYQPQTQLSGPSGPSQHPQRISSPTSLPVQALYVPPPRGASNPQQVAPGQMGPPPMRPATAPGQPQFGGSPMQPNYPGQYPPPRMQNQNQGPSSAYSHTGSFPSGQGPRPPSGRPPSESMSHQQLRKSPSARSLGSQPQSGPLPPVPGYPMQREHASSPGGFPPRDGTVNFAAVPHVHQPHPRVPFPPSATFNQRATSLATTSSWGPSTREPSPPSSPLDEEPVPQGPVTSSITAQFKCKVFLKLQHGQWKSLGGARLKLYLQQPTNVKQLVVEADSKDKAMLISTIVLTDGVERVGRTGVAIELSDNGTRTGIVYMIQTRNETSASGLFDSLLVGSDRAAGRTGKG